MDVSPKRLIVGFILIFLLGVLFSIVNGIYTTQNEDPLPLIVYAISFTSIIIGGFIVILFQSKINKVQLKRVLKILPQNEEKIVEKLLENNGALEQNRLVALTGINKVKMSRILSELERRNVVKKTNLGNTNLIALNI